MGVSFYTVKQHNLPNNSITTSLRMKIAVLFSLVVLALVAFLKPASGCDCVKYLSSAPKSFITSLEIPKAYMDSGAKVVCKVLAKNAEGKKLLKAIAKRTCGKY